MSSSGLESAYLHPLPASGVEELREHVRHAGGLCEAARRLNVSKGQLSNVLAGRRKLFAPLLLRARSIGGRRWGRGGYVRLLSAEQWRREHGGEPYERTARQRGWLGDDEEGVW